MAIDATHDPETTQVIRGACPHDCPDCCATLVTVERGRATKIQGDPNHPFTQGFLCAKVNRYLERTYHKDRLTTPLRRVGPKGSGKFEPATWEEALTDIAAKLNVIRASSDGPQAILPYSYAGTMGYVQAESMDRRFFHAIGASKLDRTICSTAGAVGMQMTVGANVGADGEGLPWSDLVLLWGTNTLTANPHLWPYVLKARENGATIIAIDPIRTRTAEQCDEWIGIRPGTDAALALAMMQIATCVDSVLHRRVVSSCTFPERGACVRVCVCLCVCASDCLPVRVCVCVSPCVARRERLAALTNVIVQYMSFFVSFQYCSPQTVS